MTQHNQYNIELKIIKQVDTALPGPLAYFQTTVVQMRGSEAPNQKVGNSNYNI